MAIFFPLSHHDTRTMLQLILLSKSILFCYLDNLYVFFSHEAEHPFTIALFFLFITFSPFVFFFFFFTLFMTIFVACSIDI